MPLSEISQMYVVFDSVSNLNGSRNRHIKFENLTHFSGIFIWQNYLLKLHTLSFNLNKYSIFCNKSFHTYEISILIFVHVTVLAVSMRSWWSTGMIPENDT